MSHYLQILKDTNSNNYLGVHFPNEEIQSFLNQLQEVLKDDFSRYSEPQQKRDQGRYHLTVLSVMEFNSVSKNIGYDKFSTYLNQIQKVDIDDIKLLGLGTAEKQGNVCYFIVCKSELLDDIRTNLNLEPKDFHITIGFKDKDVHGVRKNQLMSKTDNFLITLRDKYFSEGESFDFIKGLENFDLDFFKLIEPIKINDTNAIFRCGHNDYIQVSLVDNRLRITGKWQDTNKLPIISTTLIERKFKNTK